jgi:enoyl-CoA hydratase
VEYSNIKLEKENLIATISLNRPDALNALSPELLEELSSAVADVGRDERICRCPQLRWCKVLRWPGDWN